MRKYLSLLVLSFLISNNAFSQAVVGQDAFTAEQNERMAKSLDKGLQKFFSLTPGQAAKGLGSVIVGNKVKSTVGVVGSLTLLGAGYSAYEIKNHPEKIEYLLESHPSLIPTVEKYVGKYEWGEKYLDNIAVGEKYWTVQSDLESTQDWQDALKAVKVQVVAEAYKRDSDMSCKNPTYAQEVWKAMASSPDDFKNSPYTARARSYEINQSGNLLSKGGVDILDVNSYEILTDYSAKGDNLENDHIPAKAQLKLFIEKKLGKVNVVKPLNIEENGTVMTVSIDMHKFGRTRGGKNQPGQINADSVALKTATIKDLTNHFLFMKNKYGITSQEMNQFIESAIILWNRNKSLCLYQ